MKIKTTHRNTTYSIDLSQGIDLSLAIQTGQSASAWYVDPVEIDPVRNGPWIGSVQEGGAVNFRNIRFNPHGHGTHTECLGHITSVVHSINQNFRDFHSMARLVSLKPQVFGEDEIITEKQLFALDIEWEESLIIRTLPNSSSKRTRNWSSTNPPYLEVDAVIFLRNKGVKHLLLDVPSVDREQDGGKLLGHHAFWNVPDEPRMDATITEFVFIPDEVNDGLYFLNLQVAAIENDASPSRPVIFPLTHEMD